MADKVIKICGLKSTEAAVQAIESGANLLGVIMVPNRARTVDPEVAKNIAELCRLERQRRQVDLIDSKDLIQALVNSQELDGDDHIAYFEKASQLIRANGPYLVGVFRNQPIQDINNAVEELNLDIVQLHGSEDIDEYIEGIVSKVPVIPRILITNTSKAKETNKFLIPLLDSELGGEGALINWDDVDQFGNLESGRYLLAGGLNPENVAQGLQLSGCLGVDVSGGVETDGVKDLGKIDSFLKNSRK